MAAQGQQADHIGRANLGPKTEQAGEANTQDGNSKNHFNCSTIFALRTRETTAPLAPEESFQTACARACERLLETVQ